jgi:hypothetical protein
MFTELLISLLVIMSILIVLFIFYSYKHNDVFSKNTFLFFVPMFIIMFVLYLVGTFYKQGELFLYSYFECIGAALKSFVLEIKTEYVLKFLKESPLFSVTFYLAFCISGLTTIGSIISLFKRTIVNAFRVIKRLFNGCDIVLGVGNNSSLYLRNNKNCIVWLDEKTSKEESSILFSSCIPYIKMPFSIKSFRLLAFRKNKTYHLIKFNDVSKKASYEYINMMSKINFYKNTEFFLHIEADREQFDIIQEEYIRKLIFSNNVHVSCFSKHEILARAFFTKYPLSKFIPNSFYNANHTIQEEKNINVFLLGLGKVNKELLNMMIIDNQFVGIKNNKLINKNVNYYCYENKKEQLYCKETLRYNAEYFASLKQQTKISKPCELFTFNIDVKSQECLSNIQKKLNNDSINFIFVSIGNDYENADWANFISNLFSDDNIVVFCRVNNENVISSKNSKIIYYGDNNRVMTHDVIINDSLNYFSKNVNSIYNKLKTSSSLDNYYDIDVIEKYSNIYNALSVKFKLNLIGLDFVKAEESASISKETFMDIYVISKPISYSNYNDYFALETRNVLAFSEHLRWVAYYYSNDFKTMKEEEIKYNETKKTYEFKDLINRKHACLVNYYDLDDLYKNIVNKGKEEHHNFSVSDIESYKYDYMVMDTIYDKMINHGYSIIRLK